MTVFWYPTCDAAQRREVDKEPRETPMCKQRWEVIFAFLLRLLSPKREIGSFGVSIFQILSNMSFITRLKISLPPAASPRTRLASIVWLFEWAEGRDFCGFDSFRNNQRVSVCKADTWGHGPTCARDNCCNMYGHKVSRLASNRCEDTTDIPNRPSVAGV